MAKKTKKKAAKPAPKKATKKAAKKVTKKAVAKTMTKVVKKSSAKTGASKTKTSKPAKAAAPKGHALMSVAPGLTANDAAKSIAWYCDVLGFKVIERWEHEGQFLGAQIGSGDISFNVGQDDWKMGRDRVKGQGTRMYIVMGPDIDTYAEAIKARGGVLEHEPQDGWGMRTFSINDPDGFKLTFMTRGKK